MWRHSTKYESHPTEARSDKRAFWKAVQGQRIRSHITVTYTIRTSWSSNVRKKYSYILLACININYSMEFYVLNLPKLISIKIAKFHVTCIKLTAKTYICGMWNWMMDWSSFVIICNEVYYVQNGGHAQLRLFWLCSVRFRLTMTGRRPQLSLKSRVQYYHLY